MIDGMKVIAERGPMFFYSWNNVTMLILRGNIDVSHLKEMTAGYSEVLSRHGKLTTLTCIELVEMPKVGAAEKEEIKRMTAMTEGKTIAAQWIEGTGIIAATARAVLVSLNLMTRSTAIKTVSNAEKAIEHVMQMVKPAYSADELKAFVDAAKAKSKERGF